LNHFWPEVDALAALSTLALGDVSSHKHLLHINLWNEFDVHVKQHRPFMTSRNRIVRIIRTLSATNDMPPIDTDFIASLDVDDFARDGGLEAGLAGDVGVVDVVDCMMLVCLE
jgi:hypothetical protein